MVQAKDFASLIGRWPHAEGQTSITAFAVDVGLEYQHAATMKTRNSIPPEYWPAVIKAAERHGKDLTHDDLLKMRSARKRRPGGKSNALAMA